MSIKKIIQSNKFLYWFVRQERKVQYYLIPITSFCVKRFMRKHGLFKDEYIAKIKKFKDKHLDDRCFIIATGPSLTVADLEKLGGEITFGMNSISKIGEKTDWRPTYYGIQDLSVYKKLKSSIQKMDDDIPIFISASMMRKKDLKGKNIIGMPIDGMDHLINPNADSILFSDDCYDVIYDGYTITYSLIQLAVYMGFKEIYLLGADCSYAKQGPQHFIETGVIDPNASIAGERLIRSYKVAREYADKHGIRIYNATRGGCLELFERVNLDNFQFKS
jgi:hypothetical protein